jgi:membrane protein implicated in regulation of membrane protease activity
VENIIQADIFFFITSIAVVVSAIGVVIVAVYVIRILRDMKHISKKVSEEGDKIIGDVEYLREAAKAEGIKLKNVTDFFFSLFARRHKKEKIKKADK